MPHTLVLPWCQGESLRNNEQAGVFCLQVQAIHHWFRKQALAVGLLLLCVVDMCQCPAQ